MMFLKNNVFLITEYGNEFTFQNAIVKRYDEYLLIQVRDRVFTFLEHDVKFFRFEGFN